MPRPDDAGFARNEADALDAEIWLTGLVSFFVYFAYTSLPFYVTYLNESFTLPRLQHRYSLFLNIRGTNRFGLRGELCD